MTFNPQITRLPQPAGQPRLVWRTTYNFDSLAEATASLVHDAIEPRAGGGHTRVVVIRSDSVASLGFADTFYRRLVFNGKSAIENGHDYQEIVLGKEGPDASQEQVERQVVAAAPTIVVFLAQPESVLAIAQTVDADLPGSAKRPTYVVVNDGSVTLAPFVGTNAQRRRRVLAVNSPSNSAANARFVIRYNQARHASVTRTLNPGVSYDAFYLLAYATFALPSDAPVTGLALAGRFARLVGPGKTIEVGPTGLFEGLNVLSGGSDASIDLEGTQSGLDFDLKTGEAPSDFVLLCPAIDERGRATGEDVESGVVYRAKTRRAEGTLKCP
jgi:ABC-type branched-subunit amino acid transport system substrate-binding protein